MLHTEPPHQGIYAPLSQAMTDSESDEEIEIHNTKKQRQQQLDQKRTRRTPPNTLALNQRPQQRRQQQERLHLNYQFNTQTALGNGHPPSSYTTNMQNTFRSVMMSDIGLNGDFSSFNSDADNVAILGNDHKEINTKIPMSPLRRCCLIASLVLCLLAVLGFVWIVPCGSGSTCPAPVDRIKTHNWLNNYTKIELKGGVNIVGGLRSWENNMIFLYRGDAFFPEYKPTNTKRNGIISLIGSSGKVSWYDEMVDEPVAIDCTLLDVDHNGRPDCLVIDEYGELGAINPLSGQWHWRFRERSAQKVDAFDFPIILPDLNDDNVLDMLIISSAPLEQRTKSYVRNGDILSEPRNMVRILSGRTGKPIGEGFRIHDCEYIRKLQYENTETVSYSCLHNHTEVQRSKTLVELYALITNKSLLGLKLLSAAKISQHRHYGQHKDIDSQRNIYSLSGRELIVENRGKCPDCNVTLILSETRNGKVNLLRNFTNSGMYGMVPTQWHFKNTKTKMSGFVMKLWKWNNAGINNNNNNNNYKNTQNANKANAPNTANQANSAKANVFKDNATKPTKQQQQNQANKPNRNLQKRELDHQFPTVEFDLFDQQITKRSSYIIGNDNRYKRSINSNSNHNNTKPIMPKPNLLMKNYKMQMITETVILVLFIGADTRIENTSQSNIVQFCRSDQTVEICQPDLNNQENSMLIADLDQDGSQELVSYMSTFVQAGDYTNDWRLVTYVRLLRLQSELPVFYDDKKNN